MTAEFTCWTLIESAACGDDAGRTELVSRYSDLVKSYFVSRWQKSKPEIEDAVQDVFYECLRPEGALIRAERTRVGGFRAYLLGICRNIARRHEARWHRALSRDVGDFDFDELPIDDETPSAIFEQTWAKSVVREALEQMSNLGQGHPLLERRVQLLRERVINDTPIRELALRWSVDAAHLHHEYAEARHDFQLKLCSVLKFHLGSAELITEKHLRTLLELLR